MGKYVLKFEFDDLNASPLAFLYIYVSYELGKELLLIEIASKEREERKDNLVKASKLRDNINESLDFSCVLHLLVAEEKVGAEDEGSIIESVCLSTVKSSVL